MKVLFLKRKEIESLISMNEVLNIVEQAFREKGLKRVQMPPKPYLFYHKYNGDLRAMPSYLEALDISAVKIVNSHPNNMKLYNLPTVMATIILIDPKNGAPLSIMEGSWITAMRTGAASGIASKYLARKDSRKLGLIGAGAQAETQILAISSILNIEEVYVYDKDKEKMKIFTSKYIEKYGEKFSMNSVNKPEDAVKNMDIVVTATPSREPIVKRDWISSGMHINSIGADAPGKEELDPEILKISKIVVDDIEQAAHGGEINVPLSKGIISLKNVYAELGEIVAGFKFGRESIEEITVFCSTGLAIQDAVTAKLVYDKALEKNVGQRIEFF